MDVFRIAPLSERSRRLRDEDYKATGRNDCSRTSTEREERSNVFKLTKPWLIGTVALLIITNVKIKAFKCLDSYDLVYVTMMGERIVNPSSS